MTYRAAAALQSAIYGFLTALPALSGVPVLDAQPISGGPETYVLIGPEDVMDASDKTGAGADHRVMISVLTTAQGFFDAKQIAADISQAMEGSVLPLAVGHVVSVGFLRASARRMQGGQMRRIDQIFRVRVAL